MIEIALWIMFFTNGDRQLDQAFKTQAKCEQAVIEYKARARADKKAFCIRAEVLVPVK